MLRQCYLYLRVLLAKAVDSMVHGIGEPPPRERCGGEGGGAGGYDELVVVERPRGAVSNIYHDLFLFFGHRATRVGERLWVGSALNAADAHFVRSVPIVGIVNVTPEVPRLFEAEGVLYHQILVRDDAGCDIPREVFEDAARFIDARLAEEPRGHVLVHCFVGRSRSVALCCYHMMTRGPRRRSFDECYLEVAELRPFVRVNERFAATLRRL